MSNDQKPILKIHWEVDQYGGVPIALADYINSNFSSMKQAVTNLEFRD
jgi:hypothetical protein